MNPMHAHDNLDTAPPPSRFRRPWSPDPYDPLPVVHNIPNHTVNVNDDYWDSRPAEHPQYHRRVREPSDISVEALDLADYARTLRAQTRTVDRYPPFPSHEIQSPAAPAHRLTSPDSLHPPSLVSRGGTLSTQSHAHTSASRTSRASHRPFSLPPPAVHPIAYPTRSTNSPYISQSPPPLPYAEPEIDVSQFPSWSRGWYDSKNVKGTSPYAQAHLDNLNHFPHSSDYPTFGNALSSNDHSFPAYSSHASTRDLLPWTNEPPDLGPPIDPETKEERIRMLQREFGHRANARGDRPYNEADEYLTIGSVDKKGNLVTEGPKKRLATRVLQLMLALAAAIPSIYAAVVIKSTTGTPPPAARPAAYILYGLSVITTLSLFYLVIIRPCFGRRPKPLGPNGAPLAGGMMVLPVQSLPGGKKKKDGKKGKKTPHSAGDLQVNLIVDPNVFGGGSRQDEESDDGTVDDFGEGSMPGGYDSERRSRQRRRAPRRSVFAGLAMEEQWKVARSSLQKIFVFDLAGVLLWGAEFVYILIGKRCPSGSFDGWCNAYNVSSAAACLLCVAFGFSTFFDIKDLHASKMSPRTRT